jgi:hypothetical protein
MRRSVQAMCRTWICAKVQCLGIQVDPVVTVEINDLNTMVSHSATLIQKLEHDIDTAKRELKELEHRKPTPVPELSSVHTHSA